MSVKNPTSYRPMQHIQRGPNPFAQRLAGNNYGDRQQLLQLKETQKHDTPPPPSTLKKIADWFLGPKNPKDIGSFRGSDTFIDTASRHPLKAIEEGPANNGAGQIDYLSYLDTILVHTKPTK